MSDSSSTPDKQVDSFLQRWSRRKQEQKQQPATTNVPADENLSQTMNEATASRELPDIDALHENSEVSMFFTDQVSETLKRKALRKLFHMDKFNFCDGLDDYAEDYTLFEPLGDIVTAHQRLREESESLNKLVNDESQDGSENKQHMEEQQLAEHDALSTSHDNTPDTETLHNGLEKKEG